MMRKDNTLTKIDNYFDEKKPSEVTMMLIVAFFSLKLHIELDQVQGF